MDRTKIRACEGSFMLPEMIFCLKFYLCQVLLFQSINYFRCFDSLISRISLLLVSRRKQSLINRKHRMVASLWIDHISGKANVFSLLTVLQFEFWSYKFANDIVLFLSKKFVRQTESWPKPSSKKTNLKMDWLVRTDHHRFQSNTPDSPQSPLFVTEIMSIMQVDFLW